MTLTSGCKSMSNFSLTACLVCLIKFSISRAVAPPSLTMKFACFSEIDADPILNPFKPDLSIKVNILGPLVDAVILKIMDLSYIEFHFFGNI